MTTQTLESSCKVLDELRADHDELMPCAARLAALAASDPGAVAGKVAGCRALRDRLPEHVGEEDGVFPAIARYTGDEALVERFRDEHREILALRAALLAACEAPVTDTDNIRRLADRLAVRLIRHMAEENGSIFRRAAFC